MFMKMAKNLEDLASLGFLFWFLYLLSNSITEGKSVKGFFKNLTTKSIQMGSIGQKSKIHIPYDV